MSTHWYLFYLTWVEARNLMWLKLAGGQPRLLSQIPVRENEKKKFIRLSACDRIISDREYGWNDSSCSRRQAAAYAQGAYATEARRCVEQCSCVRERDWVFRSKVASIFKTSSKSVRLPRNPSDFLEIDFDFLEIDFDFLEIKVMSRIIYSHHINA